MRFRMVRTLINNHARHHSGKDSGCKRRKYRLGLESARCIMQMSHLYASDFPFKKFCKLDQQAETTCRNNKKNVWEKSNDAYSFSIRVQSTINHISIFVFYHNIKVKENVFFLSASWKRHCATHWREQRGMDSYRQWQISRSDCEISRNWGKKIITPSHTYL